VPIGTSLSEVFEFCGGYKEEPGKILYGGPMMGIAVPNDEMPVIKNTNAILAFNKKHSILKKPQPCIKCGKCINVCPFGINPPALAKALTEHNIENMKKFGGEVCMECGCCSFVCPANRPLVQNNRLVKQEIREDYHKNSTKGGTK
jgi:electron transport complex protein RnfC